MTALPRHGTAEKLRSILNFVDGKIVWATRTPELYAANFARAYDPDKAAEEWNATRAGTTPRWQYTTTRADFMCYAHKQYVSLKQVCEALQIDYPSQRLAVDAQVKAYNRQRGKVAILRAVTLKDGHPVWIKRTRKTHPRTSQEALDEFNREYAGKPLHLHRVKGMYRIAFHYVTHEDLMQWLQEKEAK